jgi:hypothetical protein
MALVEVESGLFVETMQEVGVDPHSVTRLLEQELSNSAVHVGRKMAIPEPTRDLFNRALRRARAGASDDRVLRPLLRALHRSERRASRDSAADERRPRHATETVSQRVSSREEQTRERIINFRKIQAFNFSRLTDGFLNSMVTVRELGVTPALWDTTDFSLSEYERQRVEAIISSLAKKSILLVSDATIWSRAIYPLLALAEQGELEALAQLPLKAEYPRFVLEGIADGAVGYNLSGPTNSLCLIMVQIHYCQVCAKND